MQAAHGTVTADSHGPLNQATVEDLDPPAALSVTPSDPISTALQAAFERDYTHLTVVDSRTRKLLGYVSIPQLRRQLADASSGIGPDDEIRKAMQSFRRSDRYRVITMATPLEELEEFFARGSGSVNGRRGGDVGLDGSSSEDGWKQEFAIITDEKRRFVLGVATVQDLLEFVKRRPA